MNRVIALFVCGPMDGRRRLIETNEVSYVSYHRKGPEDPVSVAVYMRHDLFKSGTIVWAPEGMSDAEIVKQMSHRYVREGQTPNEARLEEHATALAQHLGRVLMEASGIDVVTKRKAEDYVQLMLEQHENKIES